MKPADQDLNCFQKSAIDFKLQNYLHCVPIRQATVIYRDIYRNMCDIVIEPVHEISNNVAF